MTPPDKRRGELSQLLYVGGRRRLTLRFQERFWSLHKDVESLDTGKIPELMHILVSGVSVHREYFKALGGLVSSTVADIGHHHLFFYLVITK